MANANTLSPRDLAIACAKDSALFARVWFPQTVRQASAKGHEEVWRVLDDPRARFVNIEAARGFAKTTIARIHTAKRIAYATTGTLLYIGANEDHAQRSISWLKSKIASRDPSTGAWVLTAFAKFHGLRIGSKWNENEFEILHQNASRPIWVLGAGITGNVRGINFEDYRPGFIFCDDILTDENTNTKEQREKIFDLVFGALKQSLAPVVDDPNAKMVIGQTPHDSDDVCARAKKSSEFVTVSVPCWTRETLDAPVEEQESSWPERYPSEDLRREKIDAINGNSYSIFAREKECRLVTRETASFRIEWARRYILRPEPMYSVLGIDPVPPPSERALARSLAGKDFEAQAVVGRKRGEYFVLDLVMNQGHEPNWSVTTALNLAREHRVAKIVVEAIAYQRVLKYLIETEMRRRGVYFHVEAYKDSHRNKFTRITGTLAGPLSQGKLWVREDMTELLRQIELYPSVAHDDAIDAVSIALCGVVNPFLELESPDSLFDDVDAGYERFSPAFGAP